MSHQSETKGRGHYIHKTDKIHKVYQGGRETIGIHFLYSTYSFFNLLIFHRGYHFAFQCKMQMGFFFFFGMGPGDGICSLKLAKHMM